MRKKNNKKTCSQKKRKIVELWNKRCLKIQYTVNEGKINMKNDDEEVVEEGEVKRKGRNK